ncbi:MAG TPA: GTPase Era [Blastocatellia bacterium]|nr:GTPase Era [Blastocatellia bacterium]
MDDPPIAVDDSSRTGKCGFVTLAGRPNAGKSTLLNKLIGQKIAIVSDKPQTTRNRITGVLSHAEGQIAFVDTPGIHKPGYEMNRRMMAITVDALATVDIVLLVVDAAEPPGAGDKFSLDLVKSVAKPAFLVFNKIDRFKDKSRLLPLIERYRSEYQFTEVIPLSALTGDGIELLIGKLFDSLPAGPRLFPDDTLTDQPERLMVAEIVREKVLESTGQEIPYVTAVVTESWEERDTITRIECVVYVEKPSERAIIIGRAGQKLKQIGSAARRDIELLLGRHVYLGLFVKVRERWRDDERFLDQIGIAG